MTASSEKDGYGTHVYDNGRDKTCDICGYRRETGIYGISGTVTDDDGTAVSGAAVRLMHGNTQISQTSTDAQGNYSFSGVEPGLYNVVAEQNSVTKTILVTITDQNAANQNIKMPDGSKNSVVEVKGQTPPVVVGGVDAIAEAETVSSGDTVTVKLTVEQKDTPSDKADIDAAAQGKMIGLYLDLSLVKTVKPASGSSTDTTISDTQGKVLEVVVPYDLTGKQGITVYRKHGAEAASALTESNTGKDGTFHLDKVNGLIHIFADKFSTYAVAYTPAGQTYTLTVNGGTGSGSYPEGTIVKISAAVPSGQRFTGWTGAATANASMADTTLTMPAQDITVTARFQNISSSSGGGYTPTTAPIEISYTNGGKVSVSHKNAASHTTITLTLTPDQGYEISSVTVTDKNGKDIAVSNKGAGKYSFIMPNGKAAIHAVFTEIAVSHEDCPKNSACPIWPYTDASVDAWYHDGVHYCIENGLMDGYNSHLFGPNDNLSRAQFVQILFNHKGRPVANYRIQFDDVPGDAWYAEAVRWASAQRIISGYSSGSFGPDDNLTREQLAVILWRYAGSPSAAKEELYFSDTNQISSYALDALRWAVENDIISGSGSGQLEPKGVATRAQAAQMLSKFMN